MVINLAQCSPDSRYIVGGGGVIKQPGDIVVWDAVTLQVTELRTSQNATIHKLVVSPDSRTLAVSTHGGFGNVELWDMQTWQYITTLRPPKETLVGDISFSPDCRTLAVGYWDMSAKIWDLALGEMYELPSERKANVDTVAFLEEGAVFLTGTRCNLRTWEVATGERKGFFQLPDDQLIWKHLVTPDGNMVISIGYLGVLRLWDTRTWQHQEFNVKLKKRMTTMCCSPSSQFLAIGTDNGQIIFWRLSDMKRMGVWKICKDPVMSLSFAADGMTLIAVFCSGFDRVAACDIPLALLSTD